MHNGTQGNGQKKLIWRGEVNDYKVWRYTVHPPALRSCDTVQQIALSQKLRSFNTLLSGAIRWRCDVMFDVCSRVCGATSECSEGRSHAYYSKKFRAGTDSTLQPIQKTGEASCHRQPYDKVWALIQ